jgi:glycosyltransferase involved in cell wall biosynthesis
MFFTFVFHMTSFSFQTDDAVPETQQPKRVLVIAYYFPPMGLSGVQRTLKFVKYMRQYHWEPTVLTTGPIGYYALDKSLNDEAESLNISIVRTSGSDVNTKLAAKGDFKQRVMPVEFLRRMLSQVSNFLFVPDNKRSWARQAFKTASALIEQAAKDGTPFDLIFVSAPPFSAMRTAARLKQRFGLRLVIDYRDLWLGNQFTRYPTPLHRYANERMEQTVLNAADKIIVTNRRMKERVLAHYPFLRYDDIAIISHGFDPADFAHNGAEASIQRTDTHTHTDTKFRLGYAGIFYDFITPKFFFKAFQMIVREQPAVAADIELHFMGLLREENLNLAKRLGLENYIHNHGYLDHHDSVRMICSCDALWMMVGKTRNVDTHSSGKLYEYFGTKKPLLVSVPEGALHQSAEKYGAALITDPDDADQIKLAILKLYQAHKQGRPLEPDAEFVELHRRDYLTEQLTKEFFFALDHP